MRRSDPAARPADPPTEASTARLYTEGTAEVQERSLGGLDGGPDDRSILWVDVRRDELDDVAEALELHGALRELVSRDGVNVREDLVHVAILALVDDRAMAKAVPLDLVLARNVVITVHDEPIRGMSDPIDVVAEDARFGRLDAGRFAGLLLDGVLHGYDAAIEEVERDIDRLDEAALRSAGDEHVLSTMVALRRRIANLRRWLAPQGAVLAALTRPVDVKRSPIGQPDPAIQAHLERTLVSVERARDQLIGTFDIVMTRTGQRTNDVMKLLTIVSAVLLPSVVIAGVMGMNFHPGLFDQPDLFYVVVGAMVVLAILTLAFTRWRGWI
jgi:magnesium transporter